MSGFLSEGTFNKEQRSSFTLVSVQDGKSLSLATIEKKEGWIRFGRFWFNPKALDEGERIINQGVQRGAEVVILDEVGPFELEGRGWSRVLRLLENEYKVAQIWVVRENILDHVLKRWSIPAGQVTGISAGNEEKIIKSIISYVRNDEISQAE